jgi:hypothetical protein
MSEQRKSNWQHPNTYYREREETPGNDECDTSQRPHPYRSLPTKAVQIMANPSRDVILEAVHFLVEIGNPRHARLSGMLSIRSYSVMRQRPSRRLYFLRRNYCRKLIWNFGSTPWKPAGGKNSSFVKSRPPG